MAFVKYTLRIGQNFISDKKIADPPIRVVLPGADRLPYPLDFRAPTFQRPHRHVFLLSLTQSVHLSALGSGIRYL